MPTYNWGIIGLGRIANTFASALPASQTLYGVAASDPERAKAFAAAHHAQHVYHSYAELFADPAIDIVYVATTHNFHYANIKAALLAGKHVLAEKAITLNLRELDELIAIAKARHLILMEAQTIYHLPLYPKLAEQAQRLGRLRTIQVAFGSFIDYQPKDRLLNPNLAGGALLDIGIYALSFAQYFLSGQPHLVATQMTPSATGVDDQSTMLLRGVNGEQITVALNLQAKMPMRGLVTYDKGYFSVDNYNHADTATLVLPQNHTDVDETTISAGNGADKFVYEAQDMAEAVATGVNPTLAWTRATMAIMSQAREAWQFYYPDEQLPLV